MISFDKEINEYFEFSQLPLSEEENNNNSKNEEQEEDKKEPKDSFNCQEREGLKNKLIVLYDNVSNTLKEQKTEDITRPINNNLFSKKSPPFYIGKKRGRKIKKSKDSEGKHNKYSVDNVRRKIKSLLINALRKFFNTQIIKKCLSSKKILTLNHSQIFNAKIEYNKTFLNKTLKDIFSENISTRYNAFPLDHNKKVINDLINNGNEENKEYFSNLFKLTFIQCLNHFRQNKFIKELDGLKLFEELIPDINEKNNEDDEYIDVLRSSIKDYENAIDRKKGRKKKN